MGKGSPKNSDLKAASEIDVQGVEESYDRKGHLQPRKTNIFFKHFIS
jgi:hypothetical protein